MENLTTWLLVANSDTALIYDLSDHRELKNLKDHLLRSFDFPEGRMRNAELGSSEPGRYQAMSNPRSGFSPDTEAHRVVLERFARELAHYLDAENSAHKFKRLILCAEPHFLGILEAQLSKALKSSVIKTINKDYIPMINNSFNEFIGKIKDNLL